MGRSGWWGRGGGGGESEEGGVAGLGGASVHHVFDSRMNLGHVEALPWLSLGPIRSLLSVCHRRGGGGLSDGSLCQHHRDINSICQRNNGSLEET